MTASFLVAAFAMILRRSRGVERQQLKWIAAAAVVLPLASAAGVLSYHLEYETVGSLLATFSFVPILFAAGYAVLRYRLYDIDRIVNRTLVYGALSVTLALLYFSGMTLTQIAFRFITGQEYQPQLVIVASSLMIAVLFDPLRHRMQEFIDQRFYRRKYDAAKTLEQFSSKLRDETDLNALRVDILAVVRETMQPEHVSFWVAPVRGKEDDV
jgi:hypothetical protein